MVDSTENLHLDLGSEMVNLDQRQYLSNCAPTPNLPLP